MVRILDALGTIQTVRDTQGTNVFDEGSGNRRSKLHLGFLFCILLLGNLITRTLGDQKLRSDPDFNRSDPILLWTKGYPQYTSG